MKYSININQKAIVDQQLPIDLNDAAILDVIHTFCSSPGANRIQREGVIYVEIKPSLLLRQLPLLQWKPDTFYRRTKSLCEIGFLMAHPENRERGMAYYSPTALMSGLFSEPDDQPAPRPPVHLPPPPPPGTYPNPRVGYVPDISYGNPTPEFIGLTNTVSGVGFPYGTSDFHPDNLGRTSDNNSIIDNYIKVVEEEVNATSEKIPPSFDEIQRERLKSEINVARQTICASRATIEGQCMKLRIDAGQWAKLASHFFDEQVALADAGDAVIVKDLAKYVNHWIRTQIELGTSSHYHAHYQPPIAQPAAPRYAPSRQAASPIHSSNRRDYGDHEFK